MNFRVILHWKRQVCTEWRAVRLVFDKLLFCREWNVLKALRVLQSIGIKTVLLGKNSAHVIEAAFGCHATLFYITRSAEDARLTRSADSSDTDDYAAGRRPRSPLFS